MSEPSGPILQVYQAGPTTVVGFGDDRALDEINLVICREQLVALLENHRAHTLGFDLTGARMIPSGFLGLMASVRKLGVDVHLYNPSPDVREVLATTNLDRLMQVHQIDLSQTQNNRTPD